MERCYLECLKDSIKLGMRTDSGFKPALIPAVITRFQASGLRAVRREQLNSKRAEWKSKWTAWCWLLNQTGIGFDNDTGRVSASDEQWDNFIRQNATVKLFRYKPLDNKDDLAEIFGGTQATGRYAQRAT
ncbi:hypothetical protein MMC13_003423 [Lambiella insularis]|nr:hypothetical protein [Lambiella insularis]